MKMAKRTTGPEDKSCAEMLISSLDLQIDATLVLEWVAGNFDPEDVFDEDQLSSWAEDNGFEKSE